ncbi:MAG: glycosyl transferase family 36 [Planctomycetota bacterium]
MLPTPYGHFSADGRAYRITDYRTPMPWVNIVCNGRYGFVVSQTGSGFCWLDNSQLNVISRWDMDMVLDRTGRFLYLADLDAGRTWSLSPAPCLPAYDRYECVHEPGRTTFNTVAEDIEAQWSLAVAHDEQVEVWRVTLTNHAHRTRRLRLSSYFEWCCGMAPDFKREFHRLFITTAHDAARQSITAIKNMWDVPVRDPKEHWGKPWPYAAAHSVLGEGFERPLATADKAMFMGRYQHAASPGALGAGHPLHEGFGRFADPCAALGGDLTLAPRESVTVHFLTAIGANTDEVAGVLDRTRTAAWADEVVDSAPDRWADILDPCTIRSDEPSFTVLNSTWLPYQAISGRLWARTGYYQQSGAFGFRDQLQDSQVWLPRDPGQCADQIRLHARHQFVDGSVFHWWHPLTEAGMHVTCSDDYLWLPFVVANYLKETGEWSLLDEVEPFVDDETPATIAEHCRRAFERCFSRFGTHGMPLIGAMDWNDGLSALGVEEKGESVWLAFFLVGLLKDWSEVHERRGDRERAAEFLARRDQLIEAINAAAWDGEWFRRATTDGGDWIGTSSNTSGRIFLNPQSWAILNEAAPESRLEAAWNSVQQHLIRDMGPLLLAPAYDTPDPSIGYITRYYPGGRENGGVYMHAATWALAAAAKRRDVASVERIWRGISPALRAEADVERYQAEPYVTPGNVDGPDSGLPGKAGWTWYTGSAAWLNRVSLEWIAGIRATWDALVIDPCPFPALGAVEVTRLWRSRTLTICFDAADFKPGVEPQVRLNGEPLPGGVLHERDVPAGGEARVDVSWLGVVTRPAVPAAVPAPARAGAGA